MKRIKAIDGLRGLSIILVILCHLNVPYFQGGFVGVDVFFVISGFVITASLYDRLAAPGLITSFYERRARRLLPSLLVTLLGTSGAFLLIYEKADQLRLAETTAWAAFGLSNFFFSHSGGYFDESSLENPLLHTWSLAVEEQFYLLLSLVLFVVRAAGARRSERIATVLFNVVATGSVVSLALSIFLAHANSRFSYFLLPTRFWEIGLGILLFLLGRRVRIPSSPFLSLAGVVLIMAAAVLFNEETPYPGYLALAPTVAALFLIAGSHCEDGVATRFLASRVMVVLGKISYALYLVHWPIIVFAQDYEVRPLNPLEKGGVALASLAMATLLTFGLELPIQKRKVLATTRAIWAFGAAGIILALVGAALAYATPQPKPVQSPFAIAGITEAELERIVPSMKDDSVGFTEASQVPLIGTDADHVTAVWGDSHALDLLRNLAAHADILSYKFYVTWSTMPIVGLESTPAIERHQEELRDLFVRDGRIRNVVLCANWTGYLEGQKFSGRRLGTEPQFAFGGVAVNRRDAYAIFETQLRETVTRLTSAGKSVFICTPTPAYSFDMLKGVEELKRQGRDPNVELSCSLDDYLRANGRLLAIFSRLAAENPHTFVVPVHLAFFADERSIVARNGESLYSDGHHLAPAGSRQIGDIISGYILTHHQ